jgi:hypothetical protein
MEVGRGWEALTTKHLTILGGCEDFVQASSGLLGRPIRTLLFNHIIPQNFFNRTLPLLFK